MYQSPNTPTTVNVEDPIAVMQRFELKYILNREQIAYLQRRLEGHMQPDQFGKTSIASLYYDTPDMRLIRTSLEGLPFKEKLRLRSYGLATENSPVFLELKRKAHGVVYKRRVQTTVPRAEGFFRRENQPGAGGQIDRERKYFRDHYENRDLSVQDVAEHLGITSNYFSTLFHEATGSSFVAYLNQVRVEQAGYLLAQTKIPIGDIGFRCGFNTVQHFNRTFKKIEGMPPSQYRNTKS